MRSIELFSGAGGLAVGIHRAGFRHDALIERDHSSCDTLRANCTIDDEHPWLILEEDITRVDYGHFSLLPLDLLAGGAPCQPFSFGGKHAGQNDHRNMFPEVFRAVRALRPKAVLLENVRGLLRRSFRPYFEYLVDQLRRPHVTPDVNEAWERHRDRVAAHAWTRHDPRHAYHVDYRLYNAADLGVPQERHRVFIVGFREDVGASWSWPEPTHSEDALLYAQYVDASYWEEHQLLRRLPPARLEARVRKLVNSPKPTLRRWRTVRDAIGDLPEPVNFQPHPEIPDHVGIPDAWMYPGHTGSPWDWPAKAIKAGDHGNPGGENMLRREDGTVRYFTVRELARLQTFPDNWCFASSWTENRRQLGNAVPVRLAETMARAVWEELNRVTWHATARQGLTRTSREHEGVLVADD